MWVEATLKHEDLTSLIAQFSPFHIDLGENKKLLLRDASEILLVEGRGIRVTCEAEVRWPVLGVEVPVTVRSLVVLVEPTVSPRPTGAVLVFKLEIEHADLSGVPKMVDSRITSMVNKELAEGEPLVWNFGETLSQVFDLPPSVAPLTKFELHVATGEVRVTREAMLLAISFHSATVRHRDPEPTPVP